MKPIIVKELNIQIQEELYSAYLYQSIAAYAKSKSLDGFANWFDIQVKEEMDHARGFYNYILDRGEKVELLEIAKPPTDFKGVEVLFNTKNLKSAKEYFSSEEQFADTVNAGLSLKKKVYLHGCSLTK